MSTVYNLSDRQSFFLFKKKILRHFTPTQVSQTNVTCNVDPDLLIFESKRLWVKFEGVRELSVKTEKKLRPYLCASTLLLQMVSRFVLQ